VGRFGTWYENIIELNSLATDGFIDMFSTLCTVEADTSQVPRMPRYGSQGVYYRIDFDVILSFGLTELKAQLSWTVNVRL
jgi:hypothetical protein